MIVIIVRAVMVMFVLVLVVMVVMIVLSSLGVDIGPLLAGAGIVLMRDEMLAEEGEQIAPPHPADARFRSENRPSQSMLSENHLKVKILHELFG